MPPKNRTSAAEPEPDLSFLPDFCDPRVIFFVVAMAELIAFILVLASADAREALWVDLALISLFIQWIAFGNILVLCITRHWLRRLGPLLAASGYYSLSLIVTLAVSIIALWFAPVESSALFADNFPLGSNFIVRNMAISAIVSAVALRYFYVQHQWKTNIEAEARSRIRALQARIRPHFLFNSMNTIASLTRTDPALAERTVEDLAELFRTSLGQQDKVPLRQELDFTRRYTNIEQLRLGDRLHIEWQLNDDVSPDIKVPALILQPLMENAIYHGIEPHTAGGTVSLSIEANASDVGFRISNPVPKAHGNRKAAGNQMAQDNIRQRLKLAYGEAVRMDIKQSEDRYQVSFNIPIEEGP